MNKKKSTKTRTEIAFAFCDTKISLNNWSKLVDVMKKITSTDTVEDDNYFYFKIYYKDGLTTEDRNEIFVSVSSLPLSEGHIFLGVKEYLENHEMCFIFKKK